MAQTSRGKVLIVEDNEHIRELCAAELKEEGYEVSENNDGDGVIEQMISEKPNVLILDIMLGKISGLDILQEIRKVEELENVPVILYSARAERKHDLKSIAADFFVVKSSDLNELKRKVSQLLGQK